MTPQALRDRPLKERFEILKKSGDGLCQVQIDLYEDMLAEIDRHGSGSSKSLAAEVDELKHIVGRMKAIVDGHDD